jgi:predicted DCC family thiol-disulfide oxidoreductase YuxK
LVDDYAMATTVIYDGECDFCISCVEWVKARTEIIAFAHQKINPADYGVTKAQCEKSVVVIADRTYFAAKAVAFLLKLSGHKFLSLTLRLSGPIGELGYSYVAAHRSGFLVRILHWIIKKGL